MKLLSVLIVASIALANANILTSPSVAQLIKEKIQVLPETPVTHAIEFRNISQRIDHFNPQDQRTFTQRVYFTDEHYQPGGPIYVFFSGVTDFQLGNAIVNLQGLLIDQIARDTNGTVYALEERYFGESIPTEDLSVQNLQFLTIDQILADYAELIGQLRVEYGGEGAPKVMAFGFGNGGSFATWARQKYPHLIDAVWSSSGPVFAKMEFISYYPDITETILEWAGQDCHDRIEGAFNRMEQIIQTGNASELEELFNLSEPINLVSAQEIGTFFNTFATIISAYVEFTTNETLSFICEHFVNNEHEDDLYAFADLIKLLYGQDTELHVSYRESIEIYSQTSLDSLAARTGLRAIYYFTCSQLSWFRTSSGAPHIFGFRFPLAIYTQACRDVFDSSFTQDVIEEKNNRVNINYGGFNPNINFAYFTNGGFDPFRIQGITTDLNLYSFADVIPGYGKGLDFLDISDYDSQEMLEVKLRLLSLIDYILEN